MSNVGDSVSHKSGSSLLPYQKRRRIENHISNVVSVAFTATAARRELIEDIRDDLMTGTTVEEVDTFLQDQGFQARTRKEMIRDALGRPVAREWSEDEREQLRMLGKVKR